MMLSLMAQLIVRKLEDKVVRKLKERAAEYGVSMEEAHRRILRETLLQKKPNMSFKEYLVAPPFIDVDLMDFIPKRDKRHRKVDLG
jgi:plasmid stability protein